MEREKRRRGKHGKESVRLRHALPMKSKSIAVGTPTEFPGVSLKLLLSLSLFQCVCVCVCTHTLTHTATIKPKAQPASPTKSNTRTVDSIKASPSWIGGSWRRRLSCRRRQKSVKGGGREGGKRRERSVFYTLRDARSNRLSCIRELPPSGRHLFFSSHWHTHTRTDAHSWVKNSWFIFLASTHKHKETGKTEDIGIAAPHCVRTDCGSAIVRGEAKEPKSWYLFFLVCQPHQVVHHPTESDHIVVLFFLRFLLLLLLFYYVPFVRVHLYVCWGRTHHRSFVGLCPSMENFEDKWEKPTDFAPRPHSVVQLVATFRVDRDVSVSANSSIFEIVCCCSKEKFQVAARHMSPGALYSPMNEAHWGIEFSRFCIIGSCGRPTPPLPPPPPTSKSKKIKDRKAV